MKKITRDEADALCVRIARCCNTVGSSAYLGRCVEGILEEAGLIEILEPPTLREAVAFLANEAHELASTVSVSKSAYQKLFDALDREDRECPKS